MPAPLPELIALLPYFASAGISLAISIYCWLNQQTPGARAFSLAALIRAVSTTLFIIELLSPDLPSKLFWDSLQWITPVGAVFMLAFVFDFTGIRLRWPMLVYGVLAAPGLALTAFMVTQSGSPLAHRDPQLIPGSPFAELTYTFTTPVYLVVGYSYLLVLAGIAVLIYRFSRAPAAYRVQIASILIGALIPVVGALFILSGVRVGPYRDSAPLWYLLGNAVIAWGLMRWRLFSVAPVAHNVLFDTMSDLIYVTDSQNRLVDLNAAAERQLGRPAREVIGQNVADIWPYWRALIDRLQDPGEMSRTIAFDDTRGAAIYDLRVTPLPSTGSSGDWNASGRLIVARDVTLRRLTEQQEQEQRALAEALTGVSLALNSSLNLDEVLALILENMQKIIPCERTNISLIGEDGMVRVAQQRGYEGQLRDYLKQVALPVTYLTFQKMITTGQPFLSPDVHNDPVWETPRGVRLPMTSYLGAPVVVDGKPIGFINLDDVRPDVFTSADAEHLHTFSALAAIAIKNARQYADIQARNAELDAFGHTVAHDLKNPLATMLGFANIARTSPDLTDDERNTYLQHIETFGYKASEIVESLLLLATLRDSDIHVSPVETGMVVESAVQRLAGHIAERRVTVETAPDLPTVVAYAPWLEEVLTNLIGNAVKYGGRKNADPRVWISGRKVKGRIRIEVKDNGLGITPADQQRLFKPFSRFHRAEGEGHGLGLNIVQRIIHRLGGTVGVSSKPGQGSTFWFELNPSPKPPKGRKS